MASAKKQTHSIGMLAVAIVAGFLFATSARLFAGTDSSSPDDVRGLLSEYSAALDVLEDEVADLRVRRDAALERENPGIPVVSAVLLEAVDEVAVRGPGVRVRLWDAPSLVNGDLDPNNLVVHQQDVEAVINALWAGGAEAITIQGQRITSNTAIRCVGNVLLLHGRQYSPPFVIEAIGDSTQLSASIESAPAIRAYLEWVDMVGLGWELSSQIAIEMPAYVGPRQIVYATINEGTSEG